MKILIVQQRYHKKDHSDTDFKTIQCVLAYLYTEDSEVSLIS